MPAKKFIESSPSRRSDLSVSALALFSWTAYRVCPRRISVSFERRLQGPKIHNGRIVLPFSNGMACAEIASFDDQLEAFLRFEYLRGRDPDDAPKIL